MLTGHWTFDADTVDGDRAADATGGGLTATLDPAVTVVPGRLGEALRFDGKGRAVIPAAPQLMLQQMIGFSLAFFVHVDEKPTGGWRGVLYKSVGDNDARGLGMWLYPDAMRLRIQLFTTKGPEYVDLHATPRIGEWTHVAMAVDADEMYAYADGEFDAGVALEHPVVPITGPLYVGCDPTGLGFAGAVDDLRVYGSTLAPDAVRVLATE
jgi:Concanavalin A-like lectin/glucanases superfamily